MTWADRINRRLSELNWSQAELSRRSGVPYTSIRKYLSGGRAVKQPKLEKLEPICEALRVTVQWALLGTGGMTTTPAETRLPVWRLSSIGGVMDTHIVPKSEEFGPIGEFAAPPGAGLGDIWVSVDNDDMAPRVPRGAQVLLLVGTLPKPGDIVVAALASTGETIVREYRLVSIVNGVRTVSLVPANERAPTITSSKPEEIAILGRVSHILIPL